MRKEKYRVNLTAIMEVDADWDKWTKRDIEAHFRHRLSGEIIEKIKIEKLKS